MRRRTAALTVGPLIALGLVGWYLTVRQAGDMQGMVTCFGYGIETGHGGVPPTDAVTALSVGRLNACAITAYNKKIVCWDLFDKTYYSGVSTPIWMAQPAPSAPLVLTPT